jgi:hypothetical protein
VPWSYSSLNAFEQCPRRFHLTRITKQVKESQTSATIHGNEVHKALERAVEGSMALPQKYHGYQPIVDRLRAAPGKKVLEYKFGLTKDLRPAEFFGKDVWVRGVLDIGIIREKSALVLDYKTGKRKLDTDQLRLFALAGLSLWPHALRVNTGYVWLMPDKLDSDVFTPADKSGLYQEFSTRVHRMEIAEKNNDWPARPSGLCRQWCPVGHSLCEHCGK